MGCGLSSSSAKQVQETTVKPIKGNHDGTRATGSKCFVTEEVAQGTCVATNGLRTAGCADIGGAAALPPKVGAVGSPAAAGRVAGSWRKPQEELSSWESAPTPAPDGAGAGDADAAAAAAGAVSAVPPSATQHAGGSVECGVEVGPRFPSTALPLPGAVSPRTDSRASSPASVGGYPPRSRSQSCVLSEICDLPFAVDLLVEELSGLSEAAPSAVAAGRGNFGPAPAAAAPDEGPVAPERAAAARASMADLAAHRFLREPGKDLVGTPSTSASVFPDVEVPKASYMLLLTWARWGRNSLRIKQEEKLKALQHIRYPKMQYRPRTPISSPQPTPRGREADGGGGRTDTSPLLVERPMCARGGSARGLSGAAGSIFEDMRQEQRTSMDEQGTRAKLMSTLAMSSSQPTSSSPGHTPGFGVQTPNFVGSKSRASAEASVVSSGIASPLAGGQISPWILEAEALLESGHHDLESPQEGSSKSSTHHAWGVAPAADMEHEPVMLYPSAPATPGRSGNRMPSVAEGAVFVDGAEIPIMDEDELDQVELFVGSLGEGDGAEVAAAGAGAPPAVVGIGGAQGGLLAFGRGCTEGCGSLSQPSEQAAGAADGGSAAPGASPGAGGAPSADLKGGYAVGEKVNYFSKSRERWMVAWVVERKSTSVYIIDKQGKGVLAKACTAELLSEAEMRLDPMLRALSALGSEGDDDDDDEDDDEDGDVQGSARGGGGRGAAAVAPPGGRSRSSRSPRNGHRQAAKAGTSSPSSGSRSHVPSAAPPTAGTSSPVVANQALALTPRTVGKVVRDDFSSDSENEDDKPQRQKVAPPPQPRLQLAQAAVHVSPAALQQPQAASPWPKKSSAVVTHRGARALRGSGHGPLVAKVWAPARGGRLVRSDFSSDESSDGAAPGAATRCQKPLGRILRDDFSDDSDDG